MSSEQEMSQALYVLEQYKAQAENLSRQRQMVMISLEEHMRAKLTITECAATKEGTEMLVPVGANAFLFAKVHTPDTVLLGIGADVIIEDSPNGAVEKLDESIRMLEDADKRICARIAEIEQQSAALSAELEREMGSAEGRTR
jgi:prefoldin alpha subunit